MPKSRNKGINQGEGNRTADRAYRRHVRKFLEQEDPEALARKALKEMPPETPMRRAALTGPTRAQVADRPGLLRLGLYHLLETVAWLGDKAGALAAQVAAEPRRTGRV